MKKITVFVLCLALGLVVVGCQSSQTRAPEGSVIGGLLGAAAGGIIGHQSGHGLEGAAIGAATGAVGGAVVGNSIPKEQAQAASVSATDSVPISQIIDMTKQGVSEAIIIDRIRSAKTQYALTAADINYLKSQGVSQAVINVMLEK